MSTAFVAIQGFETAPIDNGLILFQASSGKFIMLNKSAAELWTELATPKTRSDLAAWICASYADLDPAKADEDVTEILTHLQELGVVADQPA